MLDILKVAHILGLKDTFPSTPISECIVDSRKAKKGALFFALQGERSDGHEFLEEIALKGAIGAVVKKGYSKSAYGMSLILVDDPLIALQQVAKTILSARKTPIIAITGSLGKTTTKEFLFHILSKRALTAANPGNYNSQIGLPLTVLNHTTGQEEYLILEMGMTHPKQIQKLTEIAPPHIAILTTVSLVHACNFESLKEIAQAKAEIFSHPNTAVKIVPQEIVKKFPELFLEGNFLTFSLTEKDADYYLELSEHQFSITFKDEYTVFPLLSIPGKHNLHNFLAACVAAKALGFSWEDIREASLSLKLPEKRLQFVEKQGITFINDSYNAAVESMNAALQEMPHAKNGGKKIAVLGEMLELGQFSISSHLDVGKEALKHVQKLFLFGNGTKVIHDLWTEKGHDSSYYTHFEDLVVDLKKEVERGDVVLLKGSSANNLWKILDHFEG